jgi:hypothetical protein
MLDPRWQGALDSLPAGAAGRDGLRVVLSFQSGAGQYCRLFRAAAPGAEGEGLACHDSTVWRLAAWDASGTAAADDFRLAGPSALIDGAMTALGGTAAFDATEEAASIARQWRQR